MQWLVGTIVLNFVFTFSVSGVSKLGHIGGFVAGGLATAAIAGVPWNRRRMQTQVQVAGLAGMFAVIVLGVVWRTAVLA